MLHYALTVKWIINWIQLQTSTIYYTYNTLKPWRDGTTHSSPNCRRDIEIHLSINLSHTYTRVSRYIRLLCVGIFVSAMVRAMNIIRLTESLMDEPAFGLNGVHVVNLLSMDWWCCWRMRFAPFRAISLPGTERDTNLSLFRPSQWSVRVCSVQLGNETLTLAISWCRASSKNWTWHELFLFFVVNATVRQLCSAARCFCTWQMWEVARY